MESCFSSIKTERTARKVYRIRAQAHSDMFAILDASTILLDVIGRRETSVRYSLKKLEAL